MYLRFECILWVVHLSPEYGCVHVNYVDATECPGEQEFLFAPYSVFTVESISWKDNPVWNDPHEVDLLASPDNKLEPEDLPLAPWC